jgi:biopolymer transport protein TolR
MRRSRKAINQMNVVPYIDVMLVLLVIFMVTAPLITGQVELPSMGQKLAVPVQPLEVTVRRDGTYALRDMTSSTSPVRVSRDELVARIKEAQARHADQPVVIAADKSVAYDEVVKVLDTLQSRGIRKVGLLVRQPG